MERWKDIDAFPGYQISDTGKVRSYINNRHGIGSEAHEIKPYISKEGRVTVQLGRGNRKSIHRLVANAYIPNPDNLPIVRHLDDNPRNNHVDNLAWGTQKDNMQDCVKHGRLVGDTRAAVNAKKKGVIAYSKNDGTTMKFDSIQEAARTLGVWPQHICNVLQGKISQTGGWIFEYVKEGE